MKAPKRTILIWKAYTVIIIIINIVPSEFFPAPGAYYFFSMFFFYCITILLDIFISFLSPNFWVTLYFFANLWWFYPQYLGFHHSFIILFFFHWINTLICHFFSDLTKYINVSFALISVHHLRDVIKIVINRSLETLVY